MCSIGEDDFGDEGAAHTMEPPLESLTLNELSGVCPKCNTDPVAVKLSCKEAECKACFLIYVRHKFRASLGSSKILPKNADVLLIFDGSANGVALLDMAHYAQSQNTFKRLHCNLKVLIVDDSFLGHQCAEYSAKVLEILKKYEISSYYTSLASKKRPLEIDTKSVVELRTHSSHEEEKLQSILDGIKSLSSRQDFITNLRKDVIRNAAQHLNTHFVFLSDISSDLATVFLANISLGRGGSTAHDIALLDDRIDNLKLIRPLKDLTAAEVGYYIEFSNLPTVEWNSYGVTSDTAMASIQNLTKSFVDNLQEKFPATVSTVFRTGNKVTTKHQLKSTSSQGEAMVCRLCRSVIDSDDSKTLYAIEFSRIVSESAADGLNDIGKLETDAWQQLQEENKKQFCHACRNIWRDVRIDSDDLESFL